MHPSSSALTRIYGTPKMQKFSSCDLLSPIVPNDYSLKDTFSFVSQIKNANLSKKIYYFLRCN